MASFSIKAYNSTVLTVLSSKGKGLLCERTQIINSILIEMLNYLNVN